MKLSESDVSGAVSEYTREIPAILVKAGSGHPDLSSLPVNMVLYCLQSGQGGVVARAFSDTLSCDGPAEKVASAEVLSDMEKLAHVFDVSAAVQLVEGMSPVELLLKAAAKVLGDVDVNLPGATRTHGTVNANFSVPFDKEAASGFDEAGRDLLTPDPETAVRVARSHYPSLRKEAQVLEVTLDRGYRQTVNGMDTLQVGLEEFDITKLAGACLALEALAKLASESDHPEVDRATRAVLARCPAARKVSNVWVLEKAGTAAMFMNDPYTLALCIRGLAAEGAYGEAAKLAAVKDLEAIA